MSMLTMTHQAQGAISRYLATPSRVDDITNEVLALYVYGMCDEEAGSVDHPAGWHVRDGKRVVMTCDGERFVLLVFGTEEVARRHVAEVRAEWMAWNMDGEGGES